MALSTLWKRISYYVKKYSRFFHVLVPDLPSFVQGYIIRHLTHLLSSGYILEEDDAAHDAKELRLVNAVENCLNYCKDCIKYAFQHIENTSQASWDRICSIIGNK